MKWHVNSHLILLPTACLLAGQAHAEKILLADNSQVLDAFKQATGTPAPALITQVDGGTRIEWQGGVTTDLYTNRTSGGTLLNPLSDGDFHRVQVTGDLRRISPDNQTSYVQFMGTQSNDQSVQRDQNMVNSFQVGHFSESSQLAFGDVNADFSALGTSLGVRGLLGATRIGDSVLSLMVGTIAPTWNEVVDDKDRSEYLRNAFSAKLESPLSSSASVFLTVQSYADDPATVSSEMKILKPVSGHTGTAGLAYREGRLALDAEVGVSNWSPEDQDDKTTHALVLDGTWTADSYALSAGYHDVGIYYTSLSAEAQPGIREAYIAGNWQTSSWLALQGDLRHSENKMVDVAGSVTAVSTDSAMITQSISFGADWPGLGLSLSQNLSDGENEDGSDSLQWGYGASLSYTAQEWNGAFGFDRRRLTNDAAPVSDGTTDLWSLQVGRTLMDDPSNPRWLLSLGANASLQDQELDVGGSTRTKQFGLNLAASRTGWGTLSAGYSHGWIDPTGGGPDLQNRAYALEATHPFRGDTGSLKIYLQNSDNYSGDPTLENDAWTLGVQLVLIF